MRMKCFFKCLSLRCRLAIRATCKQVSLPLFLCHSLTVCPLACTHPPIPIAILILLVTFWLSSLPCLRLTFFAMCFVWHANFAARIEGHVSCGFRSAPVCVCRWAGVCVTYFQAGQQLYVCVCVCVLACWAPSWSCSTEIYDDNRVYLTVCLFCPVASKRLTDKNHTLIMECHRFILHAQKMK